MANIRREAGLAAKNDTRKSHRGDYAKLARQLTPMRIRIREGAEVQNQSTLAWRLIEDETVVSGVITGVGSAMWFEGGQKWYAAPADVEEAE